MSEVEDVSIVNAYVTADFANPAIIDLRGWRHVRFTSQGTHGVIRYTDNSSLVTSVMKNELGNIPPSNASLTAYNFDNINNVIFMLSDTGFAYCSFLCWGRIE